MGEQGDDEDHGLTVLLGARSIAARIKSLYGPFRQGDVGKPVEDWFVWPLAEPIDAPIRVVAEERRARSIGRARGGISTATPF